MSFNEGEAWLFIFVGSVLGFMSGYYFYGAFKIYEKTILRYGTFLCWAFGHKFIVKLRDDKIEDGRRHAYITYTDSPMCVRCGIDRP